MGLSNALLAGALATGLVLSPSAAAWGQGVSGVVESTVEPSAERNPEDNWFKVCDELDDGRRACIMRQVVYNRGVFMGSFLLRDDPSQDSRLLAVASVPSGVLLPFGLTWQIDASRPVRVPYMVCDPSACSAQLVVNEAYIQSLKRGGVLKLTAKNRRNEDITVEVTLNGFTAVYDNENAMTIDEYSAASSPDNVLERSLQDFAERARQELLGADAPPPEDGAPPPPPPQ